MKIVFVTGGSGFVGRNLVRGLLSAGYGVRGLARSADTAEALQALGAQAVRGHVLDREALVTGMAGCWGLIHAAADTNHAEATAEQERTNIEGTRSVFQAARAAGVVRGVQVSTESVLADGRPIVGADESWPIPTRHAGGYARTKALAEQVALAESQGGLTVCAIRPRFVWGRDDTSALPEIIRAVEDGRLKWIDSGRYLTSTAHVANVVQGALDALERGAAGQAYFITDGEPLPFREFLSALLSTQGVTPPAADIPRWVVRLAITAGGWLHALSGGRVKPPMSWQEYATVAHEVTVRDDRARAELGYRPAVTVDEGLAELRAGGVWARSG